MTDVAPAGSPPAAPAISRSALINLSGQVVTGVVALACVPPTVRLLGIDRYGLLSLVWVLVGYFSLLDLGLGPAVTRTVADVVATRRTERVPAVFWTAVRLQFALACAGGAVLAWFAPSIVDRVLSVPQDLRGEARASLYLCAVALPGVLMSSSLVGLLQGARRFDLTNAALVPMGVLQFVLPVVCGWWWPNLAFVVGVLLVSRLAIVGLLFRLAVSVFPAVGGGARFDVEESRRLYAFGGWLTVSSVVSPLMVYADRFLLGHLRSMAAVSHYSVPSDAATRLLIVPRSLVPVLFPVFSATPDAAHRSRLAARGLKFILVLIGVPIVALIVGAPDLMTLWMGEAFASASALTLQILLAGVLLNALAYVPSSLTQAAGRADVTAAIHLVELPAYGVVAYFAIDSWGAAGAAAAWSLRTAVDLVALLWLSRRVAGLSANALLEQRLPAILVTLTFAVLLGGAAASVAGATIWRLVAAALAGALAAWISWAFWLTAEDRRQLLPSSLAGRRAAVTDRAIAGER